MFQIYGSCRVIWRKHSNWTSNNSHWNSTLGFDQTNELLNQQQRRLLISKFGWCSSLICWSRSHVTISNGQNLNIYYQPLWLRVKPFLLRQNPHLWCFGIHNHYQPYSATRFMVIPPKTAVATIYHECFHNMTIRLLVVSTDAKINLRYCREQNRHWTIWSAPVSSALALTIPSGKLT